MPSTGSLNNLKIMTEWKWKSYKDDVVSRIHGVNNPGDDMHYERNGQHPPENRMKSVEPLEDVAGKRVPGRKKANKTEKTLA